MPTRQSNPISPARVAGAGRAGTRRCGIDNGAVDATALASIRPNRGTGQRWAAFSLLVACLLAGGLMVGCGGPDDDGTDAAGMPRFPDQALADGRAVWMNTCRACHLLGAAGAPAVTDYANWAPRIAKGRAALYLGPLHGIQDDTGAYKMPPRAGNDRLSDAQIESAVDYMLAAVEYLHERGQ